MTTATDDSAIRFAGRKYQPTCPRCGNESSHDESFCDDCNTEIDDD